MGLCFGVTLGFGMLKPKRLKDQKEDPTDRKNSINSKCAALQEVIVHNVSGQLPKVKCPTCNHDETLMDSFKGYTICRQCRVWYYDTLKRLSKLGIKFTI